MHVDLAKFSKFLEKLLHVYFSDGLIQVTDVDFDGSSLDGLPSRAGVRPYHNGFSDDFWLAVPSWPISSVIFRGWLAFRFLAFGFFDDVVGALVGLLLFLQSFGFFVVGNDCV